MNGKEAKEWAIFALKSVISMYEENPTMEEEDRKRRSDGAQEAINYFETEDLIGLYNQVEVQTDVAVQILTNTNTGEISLGWIRDPKMIEIWKKSAHFVNGVDMRGDK